MSSNVRIVSVGPRRIAQFHELLGTVARERRWLAMVDAPPLEDVTHFVLESLAEGGIHLAALDRDELIGWCDVRRAARIGSAHVGRLGMGVAIGARGRGIGGALLDEVIARATRKGIERIELEVFGSNTSAIALYAGRGFRHEGTRRDAWRLDGWHEDILWMARLTSDAAAPASRTPAEVPA